ncbi:MAG TPA: hypothetical protein VM662_01285 [Sphingomonas sp.]|nr:hypothetical protein [Sphingomonas sp.]
MQPAIRDWLGGAAVRVAVDVGPYKPNVVRYLSFATTQWYPVRKLLEARNYDDLGDDLHMLYAEGWLLTHYLQFGGKRDGQLEKYLLAINQGKPFAQAARDAFGDLDKLDAELKAYSRRRSGIPGRSVTFKPTAFGDVQISPVSPAQNALMLYDIRLHAGISREEGSRFAAQLRRDAARFANDPFALRLRAETAYLLGDQAELTAVASRWLAAAPNDPKALLFDGLGKARALQIAKSTDASAWNAARAPIVAATRQTQDDPQVFKGYYDTFVMQGVTPPAGAQSGLFHAPELVPQDDELRYQLARDFESRGLVKDAINIIRIAALQLPDKEKNAGEQEKAKEEREREKHALMGVPTHESPREMLARLEKSAAEGSDRSSTDTPPASN